MDDLADFFSDPDFTVSATRTRPGATGVTFQAIAGVVEDDGLEGRALVARRRLLYATGPDLIEGDIVDLVGLGVLATYNGQYRALEPMLRNDGLESECKLQRLA